MDQNRDNLGQFKEGHPGFKPKGALNENTKTANLLMSIILNELTEENTRFLVQEVMRNKPDVVLGLIAKIATNRNLDNLFDDRTIHIQLDDPREGLV